MKEDGTAAKSYLTNLQDTNIVEINLATDEKSYMRKYGFIQEENKFNYNIVSYYNGHPKIDLCGHLKSDPNSNIQRRKFIVWIDNDTLYFLDNNIIESIGKFEIKLKEIEAFALIQENVTALHFLYNENCKIMFLDSVAYDFLKLYFSEKEYKYDGKNTK